MNEFNRHGSSQIVPQSSGFGSPTRREEHIYLDEEAETFNFRGYLQFLAKHKWLIVALMVTGCALGWLETSLTTPLYRSSSMIQIDPPNNVLPYEEIQASYENLLGDTTQLEILQSRSLARRVVERLGLQSDPRFNTPVGSGFIDKIPAALGFLREMAEGLPLVGGRSAADISLETKNSTGLAVDFFLKNLTVQSERATRIARAAYSSHDPEFAALVVNALAEEYIELNFESKFDATTKATDFLEKQLLELKIEIEKAEEKLVTYTRESEYIDFDNENDITLQKLASLTEELTRVEAELISRRASYESVKGSTPDNFPYSLRNEMTASLEQIRFSLEQRLASLSAQFGPNWPEVVQVKEELAQVASQLNEEKRLAINLAKTDYETAQKRHRMLDGILSKERNLATDLHEASIQYNILKREVDSSKLLYEGLLQRLKEAGVSAGLKSSNIRVVDPGEVPRRPYHPPLQRNLALGLFFGLACGIGLAYLLEHMDTTIKSPEDVEREIGLPSLGVIPAFVASDAGRKLTLAKGPDSQKRHVLWEEKDLRSKMWEAYRGLSMSILLSHSDHAPQVILVTSALPGEGKSTTAINTAVVLAQSGARTLLVDIDLRKPSLARTFDMENAKGMSTFLSGNTSFAAGLHETAIPNLVMMPSGPMPPNPAELLGSARMNESLGLMRESFKYVVIDSPPVLSVTDPIMLTRHADGLILVVKGNQTPQGAVQKASERLARVGGKVLGAVINNVDLKKSEYGSYYYHYYNEDYYGEELPMDRSSESLFTQAAGEKDEPPRG